ncbi:hypothetical protein KAX75_08395, partial [candidate division WOR-3 bacterium]|nr:hypothetical protein [candidate division WOR-3 bacterium]
MKRISNAVGVVRAAFVVLLGLLLVISCTKKTTEPDDAPVVEITNPVNGSFVSGTVNITADATDDNEVDSVQFYIDDTLRSTSTA